MCLHQIHLVLIYIPIKCPSWKLRGKYQWIPGKCNFINVLVVAYGRIDILNLSGFWSLKWITVKRRIEIPAIFISRHYINTRKGENGHIDICVSSCLLNMFLMCGNDWTCNEMIWHVCVYIKDFIFIHMWHVIRLQYIHMVYGGSQTTQDLMQSCVHLVVTTTVGTVHV